MAARNALIEIARGSQIRDAAPRLVISASRACARTYCAEMRGYRAQRERESNAARQRPEWFQALLDIMPLPRRATTNRMTAPMTALMTSGTKPAPI
jgi:hypothetical protein